MELIQQLVQSLNIDEGQATGGLGLILKVLKQKLGDGGFGEISKLFPNTDELIEAAPEDDGGLLAKLGGLVSSLGGAGEGLGDLAELAGGFKSLGLDGDLLKKFLPMVLNFLKSKGGDSVSALLDGMT